MHDYFKYSKTLQVMKLTVAFIAVFIIQANAEVRPQERITLTVKNAPLEIILKEITKQTSYQCIFPEQFRQMANRVDISVSNATLEEVLAICFKDQPFTFTIVKKIIIVKQKEVKTTKTTIVSTSFNYDEIHGQVTNEKGEALAGASVQIKGTNRGTATGKDGSFEIYQVPPNAILIISFTGYADKEIRVNSKDFISITLAISANPLDAIQVIAYGTVSKRLNTGNVSTVNAAEIEKQPVSNPLLALQGRVPGMFIIQGTGMPGSAVKVQIRGQNSISNGNYPLYIIDGVPYTSQLLLVNSTFLGSSFTGGGGPPNEGNPFNYINPADIESVDILKDADATAIYGSRGANGVVLVTTKKGKAGQPKVDINMQNGWGKVPRKMKLFNTRQYLDMRYEAFKNDGATPNPNADFDLTLWDTTRYTDWQKELLGGTAQYRDIQASVSGGNINMRYLIGAGYHKETTVFPGNENDQKVSIHFNINSSSSNQRFKFQFSGNYLVNHNLLSGRDLTTLALQLPPDAPPLYKADGSINWAPGLSGSSSWPGANPIALLSEKYKDNTNNLVSNAVLSYQVLDGLFIKSSFGYTDMQTNELITVPLVVHDPSTWPYVQRYSDIAYDNIHSWIVEPQITFTKNISAGVLSALIGTTIQQNATNQIRLNASGFSSDLVLEDVQAATTIIPYNSSSTYKYNALFGRLNYNYQDKYLINLTVRRDGTSRFGPANQFHNFGAVGLGWIFSKEAFIQRIMPFLSFGKLRASFGTTGSDQVGDYTFMDLYSLSNPGVPYQGANGSGPNRIFTPDLAWEETRKLEAGGELGFLKDRIILAASFYRNRSSNQLVSYSLPSITGFTSIQKNLNALVQNKGWEFECRTENIRTKQWKWSSSINLTINRNKLLRGAPGLSAYYEAKVGHPLASFYVYHFLGVDPITGLYQVADIHGNPTGSPDPIKDASVLMDLTPTYYGGLHNSINYKGIQLDFLLQFVKKPFTSNYLDNYTPGFFGSGQAYSGSNQPITVLKRWRQPGDVSNIQRFSQNASVLNAWSNTQNSDRVYSDASYIRLKNVSLSWQMPESWRKDLHLQNASFYIQGQNLAMITNYKGLDPETSTTTTLPLLRVITLGIRVEL